MGKSTELDVITSQLQQTFKQVQHNQTSMRFFRSTLKDLSPLVHEIEQYNDQLNPPRKEIKTLIKENDAEQRNLCWNKFSSWFHLCLDGIWHKKKDEFDSSVAGNKQAVMAKDVKDTLYKLREILEILNKENFEKKISGFGGSTFRGPVSVPQNPEFTVGLDLSLSKLKMKLLRDGGSTLLVTGLGGMGKTTLATKLSCDVQVKDDVNVVEVADAKGHVDDVPPPPPGVDDHQQRLLMVAEYLDTIMGLVSSDGEVHSLAVEAVHICRGRPL